MSESPTLREQIENAVNEWCATHGGGMSTGFVIGVDFINAEGESMLCIATPTEQPTHRSMGLVRYLDVWFHDDAMATFSRLMDGEE